MQILHLSKNLINTWRNFNRTVTQVMLISCLKQVEDFFLKFSINGIFCWGRQIFNALYIVHFFPSGGGGYDVLVSFSLIEQIIKNYNLMCISSSVKYRQIFWESWMSFPNMSRTISNMCTYLISPQLVIKT